MTLQTDVWTDGWAFAFSSKSAGLTKNALTVHDLTLGVWMVVLCKIMDRFLIARPS